MAYSTPRGNAVFQTSGIAQVAGATPRNGRQANPLLLRADVGRAQPSCYDLPDDHFSYGRPGNQDVEGAREVSMRWVIHEPSREPAESSAPDYVKFNKKAATARITSARGLKNFRIEQEMNTPRGVSFPPTARSPPKMLVPSDVVPGFTYGRKVRPSTPIHDVISNRFADRAEKDLSSFYEEFHRVQDHAQTQVRKIPLTTASRGHASGAKKAMWQQVDEKELFKLSKFKRVQARIDSAHRTLGGSKEENDTEIDYAGLLDDGPALQEQKSGYVGSGGAFQEQPADATY